MRRMRLKTWAKKDPEDTRKINYKFGTYKFTSEDDISISLFRRACEAWVKSVELVNGEWYIEIYED